MSSDLFAAMSVSASGMRAQSERMRVVAENVANANTTADRPGGEPYRRKLIDFEAAERGHGGTGVAVEQVYEAGGKLPKRHEPGHPAANEQGYVKYPNVDPLIELADMRAAKRSHQASLRMFDQSRTMVMNTLNLLR
jgi:flagellar basal-body rod protein FlgC